LFHFTVMQLVRLAGCWWLVLIYFERAILLAGCWWLVCPEKKKSTTGRWLISQMNRAMVIQYMHGPRPYISFSIYLLLYIIL
jgi:hypothetical protein